MMEAIDAAPELPPQPGRAPAGRRGGDRRATRRAAERAARDAIAGTMVTAVGDLGEARAAHVDAVAGIDAARARAAEHVAAAQAEAERIVRHATAGAVGAQETYAAAYAAALSAGWAADTLDQLGYAAPGKGARGRNGHASARRKNPSPAAPAGSNAAALDASEKVTTTQPGALVEPMAPPAAPDSPPA